MNKMPDSDRSAVETPDRGFTIEALGVGALIVLSALIWGWAHYAGSVDLALHYSLVAYIADYLRWPSPDVLGISVMKQYPPVSHTVAAIVARLTGSPILGLHLVSIASAVIAYAALFGLLRFRNAQATIAAAAATTALLSGLTHGHVFVGREIVENYFFPQLFSEMCVFVLVWLRSRFALTPFVEVITAVMATFALGWVYPIAAVQLGGIAVVWRMLLIASRWRDDGRLSRLDVVAFAALVFGIVPAIVLHPRLAGTFPMATIEGYISGVSIARWLVVPGTALLLLLAAVLAAATVRGTLALRAPHAFVALCAGVAAASLAQEFATYLLGIGSVYIVHKHLFPVATLLVCAAVVCAVNLARFDGPAARDARLTWPARLVFVPATLIVLVANIKPWLGEPMAPLIRAEAFYRKVVAEHPDVDGHAIVMAGNDITNVAFSIGAVHLATEKAVILILDQKATLKERADVIAQTPVSYAFVPTAEVKDPACVRASDPQSGIVMIRYECLGPKAR